VSTWTLELPFTAGLLLNANQRLHWAERNKRTQHWRELAAWQAKAAKVPHWQRAHILAEFSFGNNIRRDVGNLNPTIKAAVDGLVDAGLLPDDDDKHLEGPDLRRVERSGLALVRLVVTDLGAALGGAA